VAERFELRFSAARWAATPGQSAVLYDGELCLGGGVMPRFKSAAERPKTEQTVAHPRHRMKQQPCPDFLHHPR
jgi:tRNA-specific 2-thiouridylase